MLRHGESQWNLENRFTGWTNVGLTKKGENEAREAGLLVSKNNLKIDTIFTSYLERATDTAKICLDQIKNNDLDIVYNWRLNERHYGALQGLNKTETAEKYGYEQVKIWRRSYDVSPPRMDKNNDAHPSKDPQYSHIEPTLLPSSESLKDTLLRVMPFLNKRLIPDVKKGKNLMIVAHGNSLRAIVKFFKQISDYDIVSLNIPTGSPFVLEINKELKVIDDYYLENVK